MSQSAYDTQIDATDSWPMDAAVLADAMTQTRAFAGDHAAADRAWSARVDAAVQGMDALDPDALDDWIEQHAGSTEPHLHEAELVAVWETAVRDVHADEQADADEEGWSL